MSTAKPGSLAQMPVIGLMSGTSLDGIDGVLVDFGGARARCIAAASAPIPAPLRAELLALNRSGADELRRAALAANALAHAYAGVVQQLLEAGGLPTAAVAAVGCHGQTVRHQPAEGYTIQLVNAALLSELTGIATVADFRSRDVAAGGQGAPLVPAFHQAAFGAAGVSRAIVNLGGFSNLTLLAPGAAARGHDCGPGNALLDAWMARHCGAAFDRDGAWAASGTLDRALLESFLAHPFFERPPPRSTGREDFDLDWVDRCLGARSCAPADVERTLLELTARAVAGCVHDARPAVREVYLCGGGAFNRFLVERIARLVDPVPVAGTRVLGIPEDQVEAMAFAWLAHQTVGARTGNLPEVTGARGRRVLGAIYPA